MKILCRICKINEGINKQSTIKYKNKTYIYKICIPCSKIAYRENKENIIRWHKLHPEKIAQYKKKYYPKRIKVSKKQDKVRGMIHRAILKGLIIRGKCIVCKKPNAQAHHEDYNKPFNIIWFCSKHHREHEEKYGQRKKKYA